MTARSLSRLARPVDRWRAQSGALRGVFALATGSAGGQAIVLLVSPIVSRIYDPSGYGAFTFLSSAAIVIGAASTLRYEYAIPLCADLHDARALLRLALGVPIAIGLAAMGFVWVFHDTLAHWVGIDLMPIGLWLGPLIVVTAWFSVYSQVAIRERAYGAVASRTFWQSAGTAVGQVGFGLIDSGPGGLVSGLFFGRSLGITSMARRYRKLLTGPGRARLGGVAGKYKYFPLVLAPSALLNNLGTYLPVMLITTWFGADTAGQLGITQRIVLAPTALISVAVGQVFSGELSLRLRNGDLQNRALYLRTTRRLLLPAVALLVALIVLVPLVIGVVLGHRWQATGDFAQAVALSVAAAFIVSPLSYVFTAYERVVTNIVLDVLRVVLVGGAGVLAWAMSVSAVSAAWFMFTGASITYAIMWYLGLKVVTEADSPSRRKMPANDDGLLHFVDTRSSPGRGHRRVKALVRSHERTISPRRFRAGAAGAVSRYSPPVRHPDHRQKSATEVVGSVSKLLLAMAVYIVALHEVYEHSVAPLYSYQGLTYRAPDHVDYALAIALTVTLALTLPRRIRRVSDFLLWIMFTLVVAPCILLSQYSDTLTPNDALTMAFVIAACFVMIRSVALVNRKPAEASHDLTHDPNRGRFVWPTLFAISALIYATVLVTNGIHITYLTFSNVYSVRADYATQTSTFPLLGYLLPAQYNVINPAFIVRGILRRQRMFLIIGVAGQLLLYLTIGQKAVLFSVLGIAVILVLFRKQRTSGTSIVASMAGLIIVSVVVDTARGSGMLTSLFARRFLMIPGELTAAYVRVFQHMPKTKFYEVLPFASNPYPGQTPGRIVGADFVGGAATNANVSWLGHGYVSLGYSGMVLESIVVALLLVLTNAATKHIPLPVACGLFFMPVVALASGSVFTTILTQGFAIALLIVWRLPGTGWVRPPPSERAPQITTKTWAAASVCGPSQS